MGIRPLAALLQNDGDFLASHQFLAKFDRIQRKRIICESSLDQRLVGHIPLVGLDFDPVEQSFGQAE